MNSQPNNTDPKTPGGKKRRIKRAVIGILIGLVSLVLLTVLICAITVAVLYHQGKNSLTVPSEDFSVTAPSGVEMENDGTVVRYNGKRYRYNQNTVAFLLIGTDKETFDEQNDAGLNGQADAVYLAVLDTEKGSVDLVVVSRDSMVEVNVYSPEGALVGTERMQLCLSYAYGDGKESSCENTLRSVSRLLYGIPIQSYLAIDLDAVGVLVDAVGGVDVPEYADNYTRKTDNTVTLSGDSALRYVRARDTAVLDSNNVRMERQMAFISAFVNKAVAQTKRSVGTPLDLYNALNGYMVTDITPGEVTYLAVNYLGGAQNMRIHTVPGQVVKGEKYAEFILDEAALYELVLELFYVEEEA